MPLASLAAPASGVRVIALHASPNAKGDLENRFTPDLIREVNALLDAVLADEAPIALVITGKGKFFSNGHDIAWLEEASSAQQQEFIRDFYRLIARLMTFPVLTVACINGHAFAGGCLLAMALDYRVMRGDAGFICMNEIDMGLVPAAKPSKILPGVFKNADWKMTAILKAKLGALVVRDMMLKGSRLAAKDALGLRVVDAIAANEAEAMRDAVSLAAALSAKAPAHNRRTVGILKYELVRDTLPVLLDGASL